MFWVSSGNLSINLEIFNIFCLISVMRYGWRSLFYFWKSNSLVQWQPWWSSIHHWLNFTKFWLNVLAKVEVSVCMHDEGGKLKYTSKICSSFIHKTISHKTCWTNIDNYEIQKNTFIIWITKLCGTGPQSSFTQLPKRNVIILATSIHHCFQNFKSSFSRSSCKGMEGTCWKHCWVYWGKSSYSCYQGTVF